jgi:ligand-binding SRPBCC domain-containing protein
MKDFLLERAQTIPRDIEEVFRFFSDPKNLGEITPPWLCFRMTSCSTESIREGTLIDYKLRIRGMPVRWRTLISAWEPPHRFVDEQVIGPYRKWIHEHRFEDRGSETHATDVVHYSVVGGALINRFLVRPDVERIFEYRTQRLAELFGDATEAGSKSLQARELEPKASGLFTRDQ